MDESLAADPYEQPLCNLPTAKLQAVHLNRRTHQRKTKEGLSAMFSISKAIISCHVQDAIPRIAGCTQHMWPRGVGGLEPDASHGECDRQEPHPGGKNNKDAAGMAACAHTACGARRAYSSQGGSIRMTSNLVPNVSGASFKVFRSACMEDSRGRTLC